MVTIFKTGKKNVPTDINVAEKIAAEMGFNSAIEHKFATFQMYSDSLFAVNNLPKMPIQHLPQIENGLADSISSYKGLMIDDAKRALVIQLANRCENARIGLCQGKPLPISFNFKLFKMKSVKLVTDNEEFEERVRSKRVGDGDLVENKKKEKFYLKKIDTPLPFEIFQTLQTQLCLDYSNQSTNTNICACLGLGNPSETFFPILFNYCNQGSLKDLLRRRGTLNEHEIAALCKQVLQGIISLHENCFISYFNIAPSKVLISDSLKVKLNGFGILQMIIDSKRALLAQGSFDERIIESQRFMSPERLLGRSRDFRSESYSVGVLALYAGGYNPFGKCKSYVEILDARRARFVSAAGSAEYHDFVSSCLEADPMMRPTPQELLEHPFVRTSLG